MDFRVNQTRHDLCYGFKHIIRSMVVAREVVVEVEELWYDKRPRSSSCYSKITYCTNGENARFWKDSWLNGRRPKDIAPLIFKCFKKKNSTVSKVMDGVLGSPSQHPWWPILRILCNSTPFGGSQLLNSAWMLSVKSSTRFMAVGSCWNVPDRAARGSFAPTQTHLDPDRPRWRVERW
jgi:hypothetical protein